MFNTGQDTLQSARFCYFNLRDLEGEPELMTAIVYVIFSKVYRDIADESLRNVEKRFVLDEAHRYITDPAFSHWIFLIVRTGRHWNIMLDLMTQSLADLDDKMKQLEIDAQRGSIRNIDQLSGGTWRETRRSALDGISECEPSLPKKEAGLINQLLPLSYARQS
jgi:DNA-binding Lrp family transcriptional regulator